MEKLQMGVAIAIVISCMGMFLSTLINESPEKGTVVLIMGFALISSFILLRMSYKELKDEQSRNNK